RVDVRVDPGRGQLLAEQGLGHRRAADVGGAEEEDVDGPSVRSAPMDPRSPVIVGVGQSLRRLENAEGASEPVAMMAEVARLAGEDSGTGDRLLKRADSVRVVELLSWPYPNPALLVADLIGASPRETVKTTTGGNSPQLLVNDTAAAIQRGDLDVAVIAGAEAIY